MSKHNLAKEPTECQACHKMIEIGHPIVRHHVSYYPERIIKVHTKCHGLIHKSKNVFPELKPDPRQTLRYYRKKGVTFWTWEIHAHDWDWLRWIDCVENGFMTEERIEKIRHQQLLDWMEESDRLYKIKLKMNVKQTWSSCQQ